jgi:hypothetical protein
MLSMLLQRETNYRHQIDINVVSLVPALKGTEATSNCKQQHCTRPQCFQEGMHTAEHLQAAALQVHTFQARRHASNNDVQLEVWHWLALIQR